MLHPGPLALRLSFFVVLALLLLVEGGSRPAEAADFTVTKVADTADGTCDADCSLREAIIAANAAAGADAIAVPAGTYLITIVGSGEDAAATGDLDITDDLTLTGAGAASTIIDGGANDRVLHIVGSTVVVDLVDVTIRNGAESLMGGGGIRNEGDLLVVDSSVTQNAVSGGIGGGGIDNFGGLTLMGTAVTDNSSDMAGGGIQNDQGEVTVIESTISGNTTGVGGGIGGGVNNFGGLLTVTGSAVIANSAGDGGGIINRGSGDTALFNTTVSDNTSLFDGAGIWNEDGSLVALNNVTITGNTADSDGGIAGDAGGVFNEPGGTFALSNTILAGNVDTGGENNDCSGALTSLAYNLIEDVSSGCTIDGDATGNISAQDALLAPLADNGGPTLTHAPLSGSPAVDAGNPAPPGSDVDACEVTDQRAVARPIDGNSDGTATCDMGAYEAPEETTPPTPTPTPTLTPTGTATPTPAQLPETGGTPGSGADVPWLALMVAGVALVGAGGALAAVRRRR